MGKWFYNGTKMNDGTKMSFYAENDMRIQEAIDSGFEEVEGQKEVKKEVLEVKPKENITATKKAKKKG
jgi:Zn ribbon nucleic-acid-binding protein